MTTHTYTHPWRDDELLYIDGRPHVYETRAGSVHWIYLYGRERRHAELFAIEARDRGVRVRWPRRVREE